MNRQDAFRERNGYPVTIYSRTERYKNHIACEEIYACGDFRYRLIADWAKWPEDLWGYMVAGVATDQRGHVFIAQRCKKAPIVEFDPEGNFVRSFGEKLNFVRPHGIFVDQDNTVWFSDDGAHVVWHIDLAGNLIEMLGTLGVPSDTGYDFLYVDPSDHTQPTTFMYVNEKGENVKAQVKNSAYLSIKRMGPPFNKPTRLVALADGRLVCSDGYGNTAIHVFGADHHLIRSWGGPGKEPGHFSIPHAVWVDRYEHVWVCDRENERMQVFTMEGQLLQMLPCNLMPFDAWTDDHFCYVIEGDGRITIFDLVTFEMKAQLGFWQCEDLVAHAMTGDPKGNLFLADLGAKSLYKLEKI